MPLSDEINNCLYQNTNFISKLFIVEENKEFLLQYINNKDIDKFLKAGNTNIDHVKKMITFIQYKEHNKLFEALLDHLLLIHEKNADNLSVLMKTCGKRMKSKDESSVTGGNNRNKPATRMYDIEIMNSMDKKLSDMKMLFEENQKLQETMQVKQEINNLETVIKIQMAELNNLKSELIQTNKRNKNLELQIKSFKLKNQIMEDSTKMQPGDSTASAVSLNKSGENYFKANNFTQAMESFTKSLEMHQRLTNGCYFDIATCQYNIARIYFEKEEWKECLEHFTSCLALRQQFYPDDHEDIADTLYFIGMVHYNLDNIHEALDCYIQSLEMYQRLPQTDVHIGIALCHHGIACIYELQQQWNKSLDHFISALKIYRQVYPKVHSYTADAMDNVARQLESLGKYSEAQEYYEEAHAMYLKLFSKDHEKVKNTAERIAHVKQLMIEKGK